MREIRGRNDKSDYFTDSESLNDVFGVGAEVMEVLALDPAEV